MNSGIIQEVERVDLTLQSAALQSVTARRRALQEAGLGLGHCCAPPASFPTQHGVSAHTVDPERTDESWPLSCHAASPTPEQETQASGVWGLGPWCPFLEF